jgi:hypothetical protein
MGVELGVRTPAESRKIPNGDHYYTIPQELGPCFVSGATVSPATYKSPVRTR